MDRLAFEFDTAAKVYSLGIPVFIWSGRFCRDSYEEELKTQIRVFNASKKPIREIFVDITIKDENGNEIDRIESVCFDHMYLKPGKAGRFRQHIDYKEDTTEIIFECSCVIFEDGTIWDLTDAYEQFDENIRKIREDKARHIKSTIIFAVVFILCVICLLYLFLSIIPRFKYKEAERHFGQGEYSTAFRIYDDLGNHLDSREKALESEYRLAGEMLEAKAYDDAAELFTKLGDYKDSETMVRESKYRKGLDFYNLKDYDASNEIFIAMPGYKDSTELIHDHKFEKAYIVAPTCTIAGILQQSCECGKVITEPAIAPGHRFASTVTKAPTCTEEGRVTKVCMVCGYTERNVTVAALDHDFEKRVATQPGCVTEGTEEYICKTCKTIEYKPIEPKGHRWIEANCTTPEACAFCGTTRGEVKPHQWNGEGVCIYCGEKFEFAIKLEGLPLTVKGRYLYDTDYLATEAGITYNLEKAEEGFKLTGKLKTVRSSTSLFESAIGPYVYYRIKDESGAVVYKDSNWLYDREMTIYGVIPKEGNYTLEFSAEPFK